MFVFSITGIHAEQIRSEERGLIAAGARTDFHDDVLVVTRVFRHQHGLEFVLQFIDFRLQVCDFSVGQREHFLVGFAFE